MRGAHDSLEIFLSQVSLFFAVEEAEEGDAVEVGDVGESLSISFDCF